MAFTPIFNVNLYLNVNQNLPTVTQKIGEGTFSTVFKAHPLDPRLGDVTVALKHIIPASKPQRTENEVKCLKDLDGRDNVCPVLSCIRENDHIVLVMPHVPHDRFQV